MYSTNCRVWVCSFHLSSETCTISWALTGSTRFFFLREIECSISANLEVHQQWCTGNLLFFSGFPNKQTAEKLLALPLSVSLTNVRMGFSLILKIVKLRAILFNFMLNLRIFTGKNVFFFCSSPLKIFISVAHKITETQYFFLVASAGFVCYWLS